MTNVVEQDDESRKLSILFRNFQTSAHLVGDVHRT